MVHCNENPIYVFLEEELGGHSPNFHIHVSVSDLYGTPTKRQVSKRQVSKRLVSKRPVSKRQVYRTPGLQNVRFQNVCFQNVQFFNFIYLLNKKYRNCQVCIPI